MTNAGPVSGPGEDHASRRDSEHDKMLRGDLYNSDDPELVEARKRARLILHELNVTAPRGNPDVYVEIVRRLIPNTETDIWIQPPFYCDYGTHIHLGAHVFFNFNCVILDAAEVTIGARTMFAPFVQIYAATHPVDAETRRTWLENAKPVIIGEDCWFGGGAIVCPGVTIGDRVVVGAGAVVTKDVPDDVVVGGNPARIIRHLA